MAEQKPRKPGTGVAFINENKKEDWHADFTGELKAFMGLPVTPHVCTCVDTVIKIRYHASHLNNMLNGNQDLIHARDLHK